MLLLLLEMAAGVAGVRAACPGNAQSKYFLWMRHAMKEGTSQGCSAWLAMKRREALGHCFAEGQTGEGVDIEGVSKGSLQRGTDLSPSGKCCAYLT